MLAYLLYLAVLAIDRERDVAQGRAFAHGAMGRRIDPSWGGPIELFLVPASAPRLWYVLSCLWDGAYKRTLAVNR